MIVPDPGNPQTLLLIGSDHRAGAPWSVGNTDTMLLVRIDPNSSTINLLSLPRDLKVEIPGARHGEAERRLLDRWREPAAEDDQAAGFPGLYVNHIIDVNFGGFEALSTRSDACTPTSTTATTTTLRYTDYSSIDIQPGYQKLCGTEALSFVRFRHTDNDIVRNARQQDFLRWVKSSSPRIRSSRTATSC